MNSRLVCSSCLSLLLCLLSKSDFMIWMCWLLDVVLRPADLTPADPFCLPSHVSQHRLSTSSPREHHLRGHHFSIQLLFSSNKDHTTSQYYNHAFTRLQQPLLLVRSGPQPAAPLAGRLHRKVRQTIRRLGVPACRLPVDLSVRRYHLYALSARSLSVYS